MPPPGHEPFLRTICENPADDAPRLVYADWLEEHGDADRGRFIRADCIADRATNRAEAERWSAIAIDLWRRHRALWVAELPSVLGLDWDWGSVRGFFSTLIVRDASRFTASEEAIFSASPVDAVTIALQHLVQPADPMQHLRAVLHSKRAGQLRRIRASQYAFGFRLGRMLRRAGRLTGLRQLWVRNTQLTDAGVAEIANTPHFASLSELDVAYNELTDRSARALANSAYLSGLTSLNVRGNAISSSGRALLREKFGDRVVTG